MKQRLSIVALFVTIFALYLCTIDAGHAWTGDFSQYIAHARNIASGRPYNDTGYIFNSLNPRIGPQLYPPVFPLALAPFYKAFGLNLKVFKAENCFFLLAALFLIYRIFRKKLGEFECLLLIAALAFNPWFLSFRNFVYADWLCMFFIYLALIHAENGLVSLFSSVTTGLFCYLAYATRSAGAITLVAIIAHDIVVNKRLRINTVFLSVSFLLPAIIQGFILQNSFGYYFLASDVSSFSEAWTSRIVFVSWRLARPFFDFFRYGMPYSAIAQTSTWLLFVFALLLMFAHYRIQIKSRALSVFDVFLPLYSLSFPIAYDWQRNFFPVAPIMLYQMLITVSRLKCKHITHAPKSIPMFLLAMLLAVNYSLSHIASSKRHLPDMANVEGKGAVQLYGFIKDNTPKNAIVVFREPRILSLYTGRRSSIYPASQNSSDYLKYFRSIDASHLVFANIFADQPPAMSLLVDRNPKIFRIVYNSLGFQVYKINYSEA